jgi:CDP-glycerol glycerophosphotransferase (TagB/SpsB family)
LIAREAKRRNIKIIGMVRSWDNLSSHGLLRVVPDVLFLQNKFLFDMAVQYQDIKESICKIIGVPHYDIVRNLNKIIRPKAEVFKELGLDPNKKLIFFGAMGNFLFIHEDEMPKVFDSIIANRGFGDDIQLLYRAHPKFGLKLMENSHLSNITFDVSGKYFNQFSIDNDENNKLLNIIHHSDVVLTVASTIAIDAAVLNKPIVCINFDGQTEYKDVVYWESVRRFFDHYTHFEALISTGGVTIAKDQKELIDSVKDAIKSPSKNEKERAKIVELFVAPLDGKASQRLSKNLLDQII